MRNQLRLGWAFVLVGLTLFAISLRAQVPVVKTTVETSSEIRAKRILGTAVQIDGNLSVGTVDDLIFNNDGILEYMVVLNEGKLVSIPWEAAKFNFEKRTATVTITRDQFKRIPTFTVETYPRFLTPEYRTQTYPLFGLTPAQERRLERRIERQEKR